MEKKNLKFKFNAKKEKKKKKKTNNLTKKCHLEKSRLINVSQQPVNDCQQLACGERGGYKERKVIFKRVYLW